MPRIVQLGEVGEVAQSGNAAVQRNIGKELLVLPQTSRTLTSDFDTSVDEDHQVWRLPPSQVTAVGTPGLTPVVNIPVWDDQLANELENHCHQLSMEVNHRCTKLVAIIAERVRVADGTIKITKACHQPDGSEKLFDAPCVKPSQMVMNGQLSPVGEQACIPAINSGGKTDAIDWAVGETSRPMGKESTDTQTQVDSLTRASSGSKHLKVIETMMETDETMQPLSACVQILACLFPCFYSHLLPEPHGKYNHSTDVDTQYHEDGAASFKQKITRLVQSRTFDMMVGWLILLNCFVMIVQMQHYGYEAQISLGMINDDGSWANAHDWFFCLEHIFNALFLFEICMRCYVLRLSLLRDGSNVLDGCCVLLSSIQLYVLDPVSGARAGGIFTLFRMFRLARFVRVMRVVRVMSIFSELRVLVDTCISSLEALAWSMVLLFIIMTMAGLLLCELLKGYIKDSNNPMDSRKWVFQYYGTSLRAFYTLFEVTMAGCWPNYFRPLIHDVNGLFVFFALAYITLVVFAIIRIITAIFLKETLQVASRDEEMMVDHQLKSRQQYIAKLRRVFEAVDTSGDGSLDITEFKIIAGHPQIKAWLQMLDLEVHDVNTLFNLLDDGDGVLSYDEFLSGVMRLKGQARSVDVVEIMRKSDQSLEILRSLQARFESGCVNETRLDHVGR